MQDAMQLRELMKGLRVIGSERALNVEITGISYDSRTVQPGDVFVCIKGFQTDGHKYASAAAANGAAAIVACDTLNMSGVPVLYTPDTRLALAQMSKAFFGDPLRDMKLIGVTGTNGKTTVTYLVKSILEAAGKKVGLIGTNQNMIGDTVIPTERTTPESFELYKIFRQMADAGAEYVVMEVSSHALELHRVGGCKFAVAAFTNLTQDHLDFHGTMEHYYEAKRKLFDMCESAVINIDDPYGARLAAGCPCPVLTYGTGKGAALGASDIAVTAKGVTYGLEYEGQMYSAHLGIPGKFSVYNSLAALGCALSLGFEAEFCLDALGKAHGVKGRAEVVPTDTDYTVLIDYAHTPDGLENIISTVNEFKTHHVVTLFGCGGDRDRTKRPKMGLAAGRLSDFLIVTSDNPRSEEPGKIIDDIMPGVIESGCPYVRIENRREAIAYALAHAEAGDIIILAGKGHETYQILKDKTIHFDEREIVHELLKEQETGHGEA